MKASELVADLEDLIKIHGDLNIVVHKQDLIAGKPVDRACDLSFREIGTMNNVKEGAGIAAFKKCKSIAFVFYPDIEPNPELDGNNRGCCEDDFFDIDSAKGLTHEKETPDYL